MPTSKSNYLPLYAQIKQSILSQIEATYKPGDLLPGEAELEQRFNVSRITIRRALDELVADGVLVRKQGKGTFVREKPITQELPRLLSWSTQMRQMGFTPKSLSCEILIVKPTKEQLQLLELPKEERLIRIRRLRSINEEPVCIMTNYLPESLVPDLAKEGLVNDSLYATLDKYGIRPVRAEDYVEARMPSAWEASQLRIERGIPLLQVTRVTRDAMNHPLYIAIVANRSDKYIYTIKFGG